MSLLFSAAVQKFMEAKRAQRLSEHTLSDYRNTFRRFTNFLGEDAEIQHIDDTTIAQFLAHDTTVSKKTTLNYHTGLSSLWSYLTMHQYTDQNIVRLVERSRPEKREIIPFNRQDILALLTVAEETDQSLRNRTIILLLLDTGIRASELCNLRLRNIDINNRKVVVYGKGDKERRVVFSRTTKDAIEKYLASRKLDHRRERNASLFVTFHGNAFDRCGLGQILDRLAARASVYPNNPHRFRHTFAIQFLRNGGNIYTLQYILGHTTLDMVKRYLAIAQMDVERDHEKASPVKGWELE